METRVENPDGLSLMGLKLSSEQALVYPDRLQQTLGRRVLVFL